MVQEALKRGADPDALHGQQAMQNGHHAETDTPLHGAINPIPIIRKKRGRKVIAIPQKKTDHIIDILLGFGADPAGIDSSGATPLIAMAKKTSLRLSDKSIRLLVGKTAEAGAIDAIEHSTGFSALHYAALSGDFELIKYLVAAGGDLEIKTRNKETPLMMAFNGLSSAMCSDIPHSIRNHTRAVDMLVSLKANINAVDLSGNTVGEKYPLVDVRYLDENKYNFSRTHPKTGRTLLGFHLARCEEYTENSLSAVSAFLDINKLHPRDRSKSISLVKKLLRDPKIRSEHAADLYDIQKRLEAHRRGMLTTPSISPISN